MSEDFKQTVDLKEKMQAQNNLPATKKSVKKNISSSPVKTKMQKRLTEGHDIDRIFSDGNNNDESKKRLNTIIKPINIGYSLMIFKFILLFLAVLFAASYVWKSVATPNIEKRVYEKEWYLVRLSDGEEFYGLITDISADPVLIESAYYNYDQENKTTDTSPSSLRLVKRGKEAYGPSGTLNIVRSQVMFMEPLREDSKVLKAIQNYEEN